MKNCIYCVVILFIMLSSFPAFSDPGNILHRNLININMGNFLKTDNWNLGHGLCNTLISDKNRPSFLIINKNLVKITNWHSLTVNITLPEEKNWVGDFGIVLGYHDINTYSSIMISKSDEYYLKLDMHKKNIATKKYLILIAKSLFSKKKNELMIINNRSSDIRIIINGNHVGDFQNINFHEFGHIGLISSNKDIIFSDLRYQSIAKH